MDLRPTALRHQGDQYNRRGRVGLLCAGTAQAKLLQAHGSAHLWLVYHVGRLDHNHSAPMHFSNILPHKPTHSARIKRRSSRTQVHLEWARHDLAKLSDVSIPSWVDGIIYGTVLIVSKKTPRIQPNHTHTHARAQPPRLRSSTALYAVLELYVSTNYLPILASWVLLGHRAHLLCAEPDRQALPRHLFAHQCALTLNPQPHNPQIPTPTPNQVIMVDGGVEQALSNGGVPDAIAR